MVYARSADQGLHNALPCLRAARQGSTNVRSRAAQMAAYAVGKPPPPPLHWQHRRGESAKLVALLAAVLLVGGLVVASVRV